MPRGYYPTASRWERRGAVYVRRRQSPAHLYQAVHRAFSTIRLLGRAGRQVRWSGHSFHTGGHVFPAAAQAGPANRAPACGDRPAAGPAGQTRIPGPTHERGEKRKERTVGKSPGRPAVPYRGGADATGAGLNSKGPATGSRNRRWRKLRDVRPINEIQDNLKIRQQQQNYFSTLICATRLQPVC